MQVSQRTAQYNLIEMNETNSQPGIVHPDKNILEDQGWNIDISNKQNLNNTLIGEHDVIYR